MKPNIQHAMVIRLTICILLITSISKISAQESFTSLRFSAITVLMYTHGSISYEQSITPKHSIGLNANANFYISPFFYLPNYRNKSGFGTYYRFRFEKQGLASFFVQSMIGYYRLSTGNQDSEYGSKNYYWGPGIGISNRIRGSKKLYFDIWCGAELGYRDYTYYNRRDDSNDPNTPTEGPKNDGVIASLRFSVEFGVCF